MTESKPAGKKMMNLLSQIGTKLTDEAQHMIIEACEVLIKDLNSEIDKQRREYTENIKFRLSSESGLDVQKRDIEKIKQRIENTQELIEKKKRNPEKVKQIENLGKEKSQKDSELKAKEEVLKPLREELNKVKAKNIIDERLNAELHEKWNKHVQDLEDKESLDQRIAQAKESIENLKKNIDKLTRLRDKLANRDGEKEILRLQALTTNLMRNNILARNTKELANNCLNAGLGLKAILDDCDKLLARNNLIADKLPITLGIKSDEYTQSIVNSYIKQEQFLVSDEQIEFSKASVAFFFRIFIVEVKVNELIVVVKDTVDDFEKTAQAIEKQNELMSNLKVEELTPELIEAAYKFNTEFSQKNIFFRQRTKEFSEILQVQQIGVDRFQEKIRSKCASQVKERQRVSEILAKDGVARTGKNTAILTGFGSEVDRLLEVNWLQHKHQELRDFKKKQEGLTDENNALIGNFSILKVILEKAKVKQAGVDRFDIQKIAKLVKEINTFLDSADKDHTILKDVERRIKELQLVYDKLIDDICEDSKNFLKENFSMKFRQSQDLSVKVEDLMNFLDLKKNDLYNIKGNVDDNDKEMQAKFLTFELQLDDANQDEEFANERQRQIQSKIDRLQKNFLRMIPIKLRDIITCSAILDSLSRLDHHIKNTEQLIKDAYKKVKDFDADFKDLEAQIRDKRVKECDKALGVAFGNLEKLIKLLDRLNEDVNVVQGDQKKLKTNKFEDQEKNRDTTQFGREIESKQDDLNDQSKRKDGFKNQLDQLKAEYQDKLKKNDSSNGQEFVKIKQGADKLSIAILVQINFLEGPMTEEINHLKDNNQAMQKKYQYKKDRHGQCGKLRAIKTDEFKNWLQKLHDMEQRQENLEKAIKDIGYTPEYAKLYLSLVQRVAANKQKTLDMDNQVANNQKILVVQATDLDYLPQKIVKNQRLDEIYTLLEQMKVSFDGFDNILDDIDKELKKLEKDVEDFMNKLRGSQYNDVFNKLRKLENSLEKLNDKLREVDNEKDAFKDELDSVKGEIKNKDSIKKKFDELVKEADRIKDQRDDIQRNVDLLKTKFDKLDKKNLSVQDCEQIMQEADIQDKNANKELGNAIDVLEQLKDLRLKFKELSKAEQERQKLISQAKDGVKNNKDQIRAMKQAIQSIMDKANDFEVLYKSMIASEDYEPRRVSIQKKLAKVKAIKDEVQKIAKQREQLEEAVNKYTDAQLDALQDLVQLQAIIEENQKVAEDIKQLSNTLQDTNRKLDERRQRTQDAEIRKHTQKHLRDVDELSKQMALQAEMVDRFEDHVQSTIADEKQSSKDKNISPELQALQKVLEELKNKLNDFKVKYNGTGNDIKNIAKDIKDKDLENTEPLPNMAAIIDRLSKVSGELKQLKIEADNLQKQIEANAGKLGSMDVDKKLKRLLDLLVDAQKVKDTMDAIKRVIDLTDSYNGYTSDDDDEGFFNKMNDNSKNLRDDLQKELARFEELEKDIRQIIEELVFAKEKNDGNIDQETQDRINNTIDKVKGVYRVANDNKESIDKNAVNNKDKMSSHTLEQKVQRRKNELEDIDRICNENLEKINEVKELIDIEVENVSNDEKFYGKYANDLKAKHADLDKITTKIGSSHKFFKNILVDNEQLSQEIQATNGEPEGKVDKRLDHFDQHLIIKKRLNHAKQQYPYEGFGREIRDIEKDIEDMMNKKPKKAAAPAYKAVAGDDIDAMLASMLNNSGESVELKRLGGGFYMFGNKKIYCKLMNGKLVVRVGGGYVGIEEFIRIYMKEKAKKVGDKYEISREVDEDAIIKQDKKQKDNFKDPKGKNVVGLGSVRAGLK
ncbi:UNKNOWN [Stylonychia lemnae]|uniref:GAR domain-containing protein n=1 Tax=Stylonychia lemnae TaxID=5949 RepID=A0A077ZQN8_STYLE|nr:UNKNOWN [Stylonychia lemnae]|eukprot:CDW71764.1 UNKNOWN [Stylonychia lemnae]